MNWLSAEGQSICTAEQSLGTVPCQAKSPSLLNKRLRRTSHIPPIQQREARKNRIETESSKVQCICAKLCNNHEPDGIIHLCHGQDANGDPHDGPYGKMPPLPWTGLKFDPRMVHQVQAFRGMSRVQSPWIKGHQSEVQPQLWACLGASILHNAAATHPCPSVAASLLPTQPSPGLCFMGETKRCSRPARRKATSRRVRGIQKRAYNS